MSSSGKPDSAKAPQATITAPPTGAHQPAPTRTAVRPGRSAASTAVSTPDSRTP